VSNNVTNVETASQIKKTLVTLRSRLRQSLVECDEAEIRYSVVRSVESASTALSKAISKLTDQIEASVEELVETPSLE